MLGTLALGAMLVAYAAAEGEGPSALWGGYADPASWLILLWAGLGPGALASYLHVQVRSAWAAAAVVHKWSIAAAAAVGTLAAARPASLLARCCP